MVGYFISSGEVHREIVPQCPIGRGGSALDPEDMNVVFDVVNFAREPIDQHGGVFAAKKPRHPCLSCELAAQDLTHDCKPGLVASGERLGAANGWPVRSGWR